jgi:hypothetical protein
MGGLYERGFQTSSVYVGRHAVEQLDEHSTADRKSWVRFPMVSLEFFFDINPLAAL